MRELFTATELADCVGLSCSSFLRHMKQGAIPRPAFGVGKRLYFTLEQREAVFEYFEGRERFSRINKGK